MRSNSSTSKCKPQNHFSLPNSVYEFSAAIQVNWMF